MDAPKLNPQDSLKVSFPKLNQSIDNANEALKKSGTAITTSNNAVNVSNEAKQLAERTQSELSQAILEGDSSPLVGQLSVGADGTVYEDGPQQRLVAEHNQVTAQLASTARVINLRQPPYNAKANGLDDDTSIIEQALTDAVEKGIKVVYSPRGFYRTTRKITIPEGVIFLGEHGITTAKWIPGRTDNFGKDGGKPASTLKGSWIFFDGVKTENAFELVEGSSIENFGFWYMGNSWDKWSKKTEVYPYGIGYDLFQPIDFAPTIVSSAAEIRMKSLFFINSYECIRIDTGSSQNVFLDDIKINPIHLGINVIKAAAHLVFNKIDIYPYWTRAYNYHGDSMRPNLYNEVYGTGIKIGDSIGGTLEQTLLTNIDVFGCADGLILGGKGVQGTNIKVDNSLRPMTIKSYKSSSLHNLSNLWLSSFVSPNYSNPVPITDGSVYVLKVETGGSLNITNLQSPRADGIGIQINRADYSTNLQNVNIEFCYYKGLILGDNVADLYRVGIHDINVHCTNVDVIPYEVYKINDSSLSGFTVSGTTPTTKLVSNILANTNHIDFSALGIDEMNRTAGNTTTNSNTPNRFKSKTSFSGSDLTWLETEQWEKRRSGGNAARGSIYVRNTSDILNSGSAMAFGVRRPSSSEMDKYLIIDAQNSAVYSDFDNLVKLGLSDYRWSEVNTVLLKSDRINFQPIPSVQASNNTLFIDNSDGKLKFKDSLGNLNLLY